MEVLDTTEEYTVTINKKNLNMEENEPFRLMISRTGSRMRVLAPDDRIYTRLIVGKFSPDAFAFFIPEDF